MTNFVRVSGDAWVNADEVTDVQVFKEAISGPLGPGPMTLNAWARYEDQEKVWKVGFYRGNKCLRVVRVASEYEGKALAQRFAREAANRRTGTRSVVEELEEELKELKKGLASE